MNRNIYDNEDPFWMSRNPEEHQDEIACMLALRYDTQKIQTNDDLQNNFKPATNTVAQDNIEE